VAGWLEWELEMETESSLLIGRRAVTIGLLLTAYRATAASPPCAPLQVLFVCPAGTVKSAIAREVLKKRASERNIFVQVQSRGIHTEDHVSSALAERLRAEAINTRSEIARDMQPGDVARADIIIAFDDAAKAPGLERSEAWDIPSWNEDYAVAKAALAPKVDALLDRIRSTPCP
jgi:protein-tyrosine-phosphatase